MIEIFEEASKHIQGDRREAYGPVQDSFLRVAGMWSKILNIQITPQQVAQCMIGFKLCREVNKHSQDNLVDICGYAALLQELEEGE